MMLPTEVTRSWTFDYGATGPIVPVSNDDTARQRARIIEATVSVLSDGHVTADVKGVKVNADGSDDRRGMYSVAIWDRATVDGIVAAWREAYGAVAS